MMWEMALVPLILLLTLLLIFFGTARWLTRWVRQLRTEELPPEEGDLPRAGPLEPLMKEIFRLARDMREARGAAEEEAKLRIAGESRWTPERLKGHVRLILRGRPFLVIANREPYSHIREEGKIKCVTPASGLVTAVEPVLRACGGTWIAHASGDADRETADEKGRLRVPPEAPAYTLKRVWLTEQEEEGYYYGFSNEGLWPLCHIAHTRPVFRSEDWEQYKKVNQKFADAALEELSGSEEPFVLIQDYHYALLPRMIREKRPDAKIALFWHIPWPSPEAFGICPWGKEILQGILGADLLGFHIQFYCNNFLDTADHLLESRIDLEQFAVDRGGHRTRVKPFPIGIAPSRGMTDGPQTASARREVMKKLGIQAAHLGVGVDRIDYTKGISEKFRAIARFLEKYPEYREKMVFVELAAPSRTSIKSYSDLGTELEAEVERINQRFQTKSWKPILFLKEQHSREQIDLFYRAADFCLITSLHDGMNLVGKEFAGIRSDERGVLILSRFAGASRELRDALLVNPYDIEEVAEAIRDAVTMKPEEQKRRMAKMRVILDEHNVYRWAADITSELVRARPDTG